MKLVMTLLVKDEADVIEANLDFHYAQGVDFVIATDNGSRDGTREILERYERDGRLHLIHEPADDYRQPRWVTRMARLAASEHRATWVINNDADEFWWPESGSLRSTLQSVPWRYGAVRAPRVNFLPVEDGDDPFYRRMVVRDVVSRNDLGRPLRPKLCHRGRRNVSVRRGSHKVIGRFLRVDPRESLCTILHFPKRSWSQFENKIALGGAAYARAEGPQTGAGNVRRALYEELEAGKLRSRYDADVVSAAQIAERLAAGAAVEDRRLQIYLDGLT